MREPTVGDRLDQYLITDVVARTGMAMVYKACDTADGDRPVCIKVPHLRYESDLTFHERFVREEAILRRLDHPGVVRALTPRDRSRAYLAMEYLDGTPLRTLIAARALSPDRALTLICELCGVLAFLHGQGIVHRDVKPENVIVGDDGRVKLVDFGIALDRQARRITWGRLSHTAGTPDYAAPERIRGRRGDERTDVYAAGLVLYEALTGCLPQSGADALAIMRARAAEDPPPPTYHVPDLDPGLNAVVCRAIARAPRDRYQTAAEMQDHLRDPRVALAEIAAREAAAGPGARRRSFALPAVVIAAVLSALFSLTWLSRAPTAAAGAPARAAAAGR
jgi:serine/threonine-protein kinase